MNLGSIKNLGSKLIILLLFSFLNPGFTAFACDVCGGSINILSAGNVRTLQNQIGWQFSQIGYSIDYRPTDYTHEFSVDRFRQIELKGRFSIDQKFQLGFSLPYLRNDMRGNTRNIQLTGWGDPNVDLWYYPKTGTTGLDKKYKLITGFMLGTSLPLGQFEMQEDLSVLNPNFQLGRGVIGARMGAQVNYLKGNKGFRTSVLTILSPHNQEGFRFGHSLNIGLSYLNQVKLKNYLLLVDLGVQHSHQGKGKIETVNLANTGMDLFWATTNVDLQIKQWVFGAGVSIPLIQKFKLEPGANMQATNLFQLSTRFLIGVETAKAKSVID
jgi:hypothetical protein